MNGHVEEFHRHGWAVQLGYVVLFSVVFLSRRSPTQKRQESQKYIFDVMQLKGGFFFLF